MTRRKNTAAQKVFDKYVRFITEAFLAQSDASYQNQETVRNRWRTEHEYSIDAEKYLIEQSRFYIRMLDSRDAKTHDPKFLLGLVKLIADYLSAYTMRAGRRTRKSAKNLLIDELYTNNRYVQNVLLKKQKEQRNMPPRQRKKIAYEKRREEEAARNAYDATVSRQVRVVFVEAIQYKKK